MAKVFLDTPSRKVSLTNTVDGDSTASSNQQPQKPRGKVYLGSTNSTASRTYSGTTKPYDKVMGEGIYHPEIGGTEIASRLHENQSVGQMVKNFAGQLGTTVLGGAIEGTGYLFDLNQGIDLAEGSKIMFGNALSRAGANIQEAGQTAMPIYVDPYKEGKFDPGSMSWWLSNGTSVASSLSLLLPIIGITAITKKVSPGVGAAIGSAFTQAAMSRQMEGLMEARGTYEEVYNTAISNGLDMKAASEQASLSAANTYNKNWLLMAQDIPQFALFGNLIKLKALNGIEDAVAKQEFLTNWLGKKAVETGAKTVSKGALLAKYGIDAGGEALEEGYQFVINKQSNALAEQAIYGDNGKDPTILNAFKESIGEGDFWTNAFFGAVGSGVMQTGMSSLGAKAMRESIRRGLAPALDFKTTISHANDLVQEGMDPSNTVDSELAYNYALANLVIAGKANNITAHQKVMMDTIFNSENEDDMALMTKWGLSPDDIKNFRENKEVAEKIIKDFDEISNIADNKFEEYKKSGKFESEDLAKKQAMAYSYYSTLLDKVDTLAKKSGESLDSFVNTNLFTLIDENTGGLRISNNAHARLVNDVLLNRVKTRIKQLDEKLKDSTITESQRKILELQKAFQEKQLEEYKESEQALFKEATELPDIEYTNGDKVSQFEKDEELLQAISIEDKDKLTTLAQQYGSLTEAVNKLKIEKEKFAQYEVPSEHKPSMKPTESSSVSPETNLKTIDLYDLVDYNGESFKVLGVEDKDGNPIDESIVSVIDDYGKVDAYYKLKRIDKVEGKEDIIRIPTKSLTETNLLERDTTIVKDDNNIGTDDFVEDVTSADNILAQAINDKLDPVLKSSPLSHIQYSHYDSDGSLVANPGAEDFAKLVSKKSTNLKNAKASLFLLEESSQAEFDNVLRVLASYKIVPSARQLSLLKKVYLQGQRLTESEINDMLGLPATGISDFTKLDRSNRLILDVLAIRTSIKYNKVTYKDGLYLPATPKYDEIKDRADRTQSKVDSTRMFRYQLLHKLLLNEGANSAVRLEPKKNTIVRNRGHVTVASKDKITGRNRKLTDVFGDEAFDLVFAVAKQTSRKGVYGLFVDKHNTLEDNTIPISVNSVGSTYVAIKSNNTLSDSKREVDAVLKLNKGRTSRSLAELIIDAFSLQAHRIQEASIKGTAIRAVSALKFEKGDRRISIPNKKGTKALTVGNFLELVTFRTPLAKETSSSYFTRRYGSNESELRAAANKHLYLRYRPNVDHGNGIEGDAIVLEYGLKDVIKDENGKITGVTHYALPLYYTYKDTTGMVALPVPYSSDGYKADREACIQWMMREKVMPIHLERRAIGAELNSNEPFLPLKPFTIYGGENHQEVILSHDGKQSYKSFLINNGFIQTDAIEETKGEGIYTMPIVDLGLSVNSFSNLVPMKSVPKTASQAEQLAMDLSDNTKQEFVNGQGNITQERLNQIQELFESNPELANSVYEALGFLYSPLTNEDKIKIDNTAKEDLAIFNKLLALTKKNNFNEAYDALVDKILEAGKDINRREEYIELGKFQEHINTYFGYLINDRNDKTAKDTKITDVINEIKKQSEKDKTKRKRNKITPQQKQEALEAYSKYLDTIFPDSQVKDIVYHGTKSENKLEVFDENQTGALDAGYFGRGFYLTPDKQYASNYIGNKGHVESLLVNLTNPLETDMNQANTNISLQNNDGAIVRYGEDVDKLNEIEQDPNEIAEIVVTNSKQIHILGSKQDIEGFTKFVKKENKTTFDPNNDPLLDEAAPFTKITQTATPANTFALKAAMKWAYDTVGIKESEWEIKEHLEDLIYDGRNNFALYAHDAIKIWNASEPSVVYHESFHRVSLGYLRPAEHARLLRAARIKYNMPDATDKEVEERLADEFQVFMQRRFTTTTKYTAIERFFVKLKQFIQRLFIGKNKLNDYDIDMLFNNISKGLYSKDFIKDRTNIKAGEYQKTIVDGRTISSLKNRKAFKDLTSTLVNQLLLVSEVTDLENITELSFSALADRIKNTLIPFSENSLQAKGLTDYQKQLYINRVELFKEVLGASYEITDKQKKRGLTGYYNFDNIWVPQINNYLKDLGVYKSKRVLDDKATTTIVDETEISANKDNDIVVNGKTVAPYNKLAYEFNRSESIRATVKYLIKSLYNHEYNKDSKTYSPITNDWGGYSFANFSNIWHELINLVYRYETPQEMIDAIEEHGNKTKNGAFLQLATKLNNPKTSESTRIQFFVGLKTAKLNFLAAEASQKKAGVGEYTVIIDDVAEKTARFGILHGWTDAIFSDPSLYSKTLHNGYPGFIKDGPNSFDRIYDEVQSTLTLQQGLISDKIRDAGTTDVITEYDIEELEDLLIDVLKKYHIEVDKKTMAYYFESLNVKTDKDNPVLHKYAQIRAALGGGEFASMFELYRQATETTTGISKRSYGVSRFASVRKLATAHLKAHPELIDDSILGPNNNRYFTFSNTSHMTDTFAKLSNDLTFLEELASSAGYEHSRLLSKLLPNPNAKDQAKEQERAQRFRDGLLLHTASHMRMPDAPGKDKGRGFFGITASEEFLFNYAAYTRATKEGVKQPLLQTPASSREAAFYIEGMPIFNKPITNVYTKKDSLEVKMEFSNEIEEYFYGVYLDEVARINNGWSVIKEYLEASDEEKVLLKKKLVKEYHFKLDGDKFDFLSANVLKFQHLSGLINNKKTSLPRTITGKYKDTFETPLSFEEFTKLNNPYLQKIILDTVDYARELGLLILDESSKNEQTALTAESYNNLLPSKDIDSKADLVDSNTRGDLTVIASLGGFTLNYVMSNIETEKVIGMYPALFKFDKTTQNSFAELYKRWYGPGSSGNRYASTTKNDSNPKYTVSIAKTQLFASKDFYDKNVIRHATKIADNLKREIDKEIKRLEYRLTKRLDEDEIKKLQAQLTDLRARSKEDFMKNATEVAKRNLKAYLEVDATDGGSLISVTMFKKLLDREGLLTEKLSDTIDRVENGEADLSEIVKYMPQKTMYFGVSFENGTAILTYDKMAMGVLFKNLAQGTALEDMYNRMNAVGKYKGNKPIDQILMDTAVKSGGRIGFEYFQDGNIMSATNDLTNIDTWERDWSNLRKQQKLEAHDDYTGQSMGSAVFKVAGSNIEEDAEYLFSNGKKVKGSTMRRSIHASREAISNIGALSIRAEYGLSKEGLDKIAFITKVQTNAIAARKPDDFINGLQYDDSTKSFRVALDATTDRTFIYNSIHKELQKKVVDLNTPGAQLVQLSNWGLTKKKSSGLLKMQQWDNDNSVFMRMECKVSTRVFRHLLPNYETMTHEQRVEALKKIAPTMLGYRTPTQGQNSVMALQIVDFLPHEAADTIYLPLEFTALTGSDYDIDKLFVAFKEYELDSNNLAKEVEFIEGTDEESINRRYRAKVNELWHMFKGSRKFISKSTLDSIYNITHTKPIEIDADAIENFVGTDEQKAELAALYVKYRLLELDKGKDSEEHQAFKASLETSINFILNPIIKADLSDVEFGLKTEALVKAGVLPKLAVFAKQSIEEQNTRKANVNHILDTYDTILLSEHHLLSTTRPLDSNKKPLKDFATAVVAAKNNNKQLETTPYLSLTPAYQAKVKANNVSASALVGPFALANAFHSITQAGKVSMNSNFNYGIGPSSTNFDLGLIRGRDGVNITDWFSALIDATVDLLKDDYIVNLNVNDATVGIVELLIKLGFGLDSFHYITQPAVQEFAKKYYERSSKLSYIMDDDGFPIYNRKNAEEVLDELIKKYSQMYGVTNEDEGVDSDLLWRFTEIMDYYHDEKNALYDLNSDNWDDENVLIRQLSIVKQLKYLLADADAVTDLTLKARIDTGKIGSTPSQKAAYELGLKKLLNSKVSINGRETSRFFNIGNVLRTGAKESTDNENMTCLPVLFENSFNLSKELLRHVSVQSTDGFRNLFNALIQQLPLYKKTYMSLGAIHNVEEALFAYFVGRYFGIDDGKETSLGVTSENIKEWFLEGPDSVYNDLQTVKNEMYTKYPDLKDNYFLQLFIADVRTNSPIKYYLRLQGKDIIDAMDIDDYKVSYDELLLHEDPFIRQLAAKLKLYAFFSTGNRHRISSPAKYLSTLSAIEVPIEINGERKKIKFTEYFDNLLNELNARPTNTGEIISPMTKFMADLTREVLVNNWWDTDLVRRVKFSVENMSDVVYKGDIAAIIIKKDYSKKLLYGYNNSDRPLYERYITIKAHGLYENWQRETEDYEIDTINEYDNFSANVLNSIALYEFIGVDALTNSPIYIPINKSSYAYKGQELHELGINKTDGKSIIPGNNLAHDISIEDRIAATNGVLLDGLPDGMDNHVIRYKPEDYVVKSRTFTFKEETGDEGDTKNRNSIVSEVVKDATTTTSSIKDITSFITSLGVSQDVKDGMLKDGDKVRDYYDYLTRGYHVIDTLEIDETLEDLSVIKVSDITNLNYLNIISRGVGGTSSFSMYVNPNILENESFKRSEVYKRFNNYMFTTSKELHKSLMAKSIEKVALADDTAFLNELLKDVLKLQEEYDSIASVVDEIQPVIKPTNENRHSSSNTSSIYNPIKVYIHEGGVESTVKGASSAVFVNNETFGHATLADEMLEKYPKYYDILKKLPAKITGTKEKSKEGINIWSLLEIDHVLDVFKDTDEFISIRVTDPTIFAFTKLQPYAMRNILELQPGPTNSAVYKYLTPFSLLKYKGIETIVANITNKIKSIEEHGGEVMLMLASVDGKTPTEFKESHDIALAQAKTLDPSGSGLYGNPYAFRQAGLYPNSTFDEGVYSRAQDILESPSDQAYSDYDTFKNNYNIKDGESTTLPTTPVIVDDILKELDEGEKQSEHCKKVK